MLKTELVEDKFDLIESSDGRFASDGRSERLLSFDNLADANCWKEVAGDNVVFLCRASGSDRCASMEDVRGGKTRSLLHWCLLSDDDRPSGSFACDDGLVSVSENVFLLAEEFVPPSAFNIKSDDL